MSDINAPKKLLVVTDSNVEKLYADEVNDLLIKNGYDSKIYAFTAGEENKGMDTILGICSACIEHEMDRKSMIVALGGGVVGDMAGLPRQYLCAVLILYKCLQHYFHSRTALSAENRY